MGLLDIDRDITKVRRVVDLVWDNRDELVDLLTRWPTLLGDAGQQMHTAGDGASQAADLLTGDVQSLTTTAANTIESSQRQLATVASVLGEVGKVLGRVPLVNGVTEPVARGLAAVGEVSDDLAIVAVQIRSIGVSLDGVGEGLGVMGTSLKGSGAALAALSGRAVDEPSTAADAAKPKDSTKPRSKKSKKSTTKTRETT